MEEPSPSAPSPVTEQYGTAPDGSILNWVRYAPDPDVFGPGPYPVVVLIHGGGFRSGTPTSSSMQMAAAQRCAATGYMAVSIWYRLAPPGDTNSDKLPGQTAPGYAPLQYDDCKTAVLAARASSWCNSQVAVMGGSAGGTHTVWLCADTNGSPNGPAWTDNDRPLGGVDLSGAHQFDDWTSDSPNIRAAVDIFCNVIPIPNTYPNPPSEADRAKLIQQSPDTVVQANVKPILVVFSADDSMPTDQRDDLITRFDSLGVTNYQNIQVDGSGHAWANWQVTIPGTSETVGDRAMSWIAGLFAANPTPTPTPTPTATPTPTPTATPAPTPTVPPILNPPPLSSVVSRKAHGTDFLYETFDAVMPLTGAPGVECRSGGAGGEYTVVFQFANQLVSVLGATVSSGTGSVSTSFMGGDPHEYVVNLTGVTNAENVVVTLNLVVDLALNAGDVVGPPIGFLLGDTNGDGTVNSADIGQTKSRSGQLVNITNFRSDVTADDTLNSGDIGLVKSKSGTALP